MAQSSKEKHKEILDKWNKLRQLSSSFFTVEEIHRLQIYPQFSLMYDAEYVGYIDNMFMFMKKHGKVT